MKLKLKINERAFNRKFKDVWKSKADFLILYGGGGSGKSESAADKILFRTLLEKGHRFVNFRKVGKTIRVSQWQLLKDKINRYKMGNLFNLTETPMTLTCKANGNQVLSVGVDDVQKLKSLAEPTGFWHEEVTEYEREDFLQLTLRLRGYSPYYKQHILSFNPIDEFHWLRTHFFPVEIEDKVANEGKAIYEKNVEVQGKIIPVTVEIIHSTYLDNKFISMDDKAKYELMKYQDENYYKVYAKGLWGKVGNLIYPAGYNIISKEEYPVFDKIIYGLDFGYTNPSALVRCGLVYKDDEYGHRPDVYLEELIYEEKLSVKELIDRMKTFDIKPSDVIYADAQDPAKIDAINNAINSEGEYCFTCVPADKDVKNGIDYLRTLDIYSCLENVNGNKEIKSYRWKLNAVTGKPIDGEPMKYNDHFEDAKRYAVYTDSKIEEFKMAFI